MTTCIQGQLEIDHQRGVIYFHSMDIKGTVTVLRICSLPTPIPNLTDLGTAGMLDITHMYGVSWGHNDEDDR